MEKMYNIDIQKEIWKDIYEYEGLYQCSNWGRIGSFRNGKWGLSKERKILRPGKNGKYGHLDVVLHKNGKGKTHKVHRLILETFVGPCPLGMECRHSDGNPANNRLDNLCWGTRRENQADRLIHATDQCGFKNSNVKLNEWQIRIIKRLFEIPDITIKEIAKIFGVCCTTIYNIKNDKIWRHIQ